MKVLNAKKLLTISTIGTDILKKEQKTNLKLWER